MNSLHTRWVLAALLVLVVAACGNTQTSQTPEQVNRHWVEALRANDRQTLLTLAAEGEAKTITVDGYLQRMQDYVQHGYVATGVRGGAFKGVDVLPTQEAGQGKVGFSRWRFEQVQICYAATLTPTDDGWRVQSWGQRTSCPNT